MNKLVNGDEQLAVLTAKLIEVRTLLADKELEELKLKSDIYVLECQMKGEKPTSWWKFITNIQLGLKNLLVHLEEKRTDRDLKKLQHPKLKEIK